MRRPPRAPPYCCQGDHNGGHLNYTPSITFPHGSIIERSIIVIERIVILQEKTKRKPLTVKSLLQSRDNRTDKSHALFCAIGARVKGWMIFLLALKLPGLATHW